MNCIVRFNQKEHTLELCTFTRRLMSKQNIIIIGNGVSGITAARHIRKLSEHNVAVISSETKYFYSRTALMYIYMGHMKFENTKPYEDHFWKKNRIDLILDEVVKLETKQKTLLLASGKTVSYDTLIIASGSKSNMPEWQGRDLKGVQSLYSFQDLRKMEQHTQSIEHAVVVGGGLIGIEMAEMLRSKNIPVSFLVREAGFWNKVLPFEESEIVNRHIREHQVDLRLSTELQEIHGDSNGRVQSVSTSDGDEIACQFLGIAVGVHPNISFLKDSGIKTRAGVLVDEYFQTNIPDIYAIGDCAEQTNPLKNRKSIEQVWYTGKIMGETLARTICSNKTSYQPGLWFNSAKFFDIEYQTYGIVPAENSKDQASFYWQDKYDKKCLRIVYDSRSKCIKGIHVLGLRLRQRVCERWITEDKTLAFAIKNLHQASFNPEFQKKYEAEIIQQYNREYPEEIIAESGRGFFRSVFQKL